MHESHGQDSARHHRRRTLLDRVGTRCARGLWQKRRFGSPRATPSSTPRAGYLPASFALRDDDSEDASIVGLWQVTFTSKGTSGIPDGTVVDAGYATWHSDGTEIMNSGRPPITGSFCMGVWKQVGR